MSGLLFVFLLDTHVAAIVKSSPERNAFPVSGVSNGCRGRVFWLRQTKEFESLDFSRSKHEVYP